jgi:hypothetical protein
MKLDSPSQQVNGMVFLYIFICDHNQGTCLSCTGEVVIRCFAVIDSLSIMASVYQREPGLTGAVDPMKFPIDLNL